MTAAATSADSAYAGLPVSDVAVTNTDDDSAGVTVSPTSGLTTTEAGGTATFTVVLTSRPTADVMIGLGTSDTTEGAAAPTPLRFTSLNWNTPQTVTVTGADDILDDGDVAYTIVTHGDQRRHDLPAGSPWPTSGSPTPTTTPRASP